MWMLVRGLLVAAIASLVGGVSVAQEVVRTPAYDEIGHALIFPVGDMRENRSGLVRVSLDDFSSTALPMPCGHYPPEKIVFLDQGRLLAVSASPASKPANLQRGNARQPEDVRYWQPYDLVVLQQSDWSAVHKFDIDQPVTLPLRTSREALADISAPDRGRMLLLAIEEPALTRAPRAIYGLSVDDWRMTLLWPTKPDFDYRNDDSFLELQAPQWIEDGSWVVRGLPNGKNKQWNVPYEKRTHPNRWLINPIDQSVRLHPFNDVLRMGFTLQQMDGDVYMSVITRNVRGLATYGLKKVTRGSAQLLGSLGTTSPGSMYSPAAANGMSCRGRAMGA